MQGLADGYFVIPYTLGNYLAPSRLEKSTPRTPAVQDAEREVDDRARSGSSASTAEAHRRRLPPRARQDHVGRLRHGARRRRASTHALGEDPGAARGVLEGRPRRRATATSSTSSSRRPAASPTSSSSASSSASTPSSANESCGGHFRVEYQTPDGEAAAQRRRLRLRRRPGSTRATARSRSLPQGAARLRERPPRSSGATSERP